VRLQLLFFVCTYYGSHYSVDRSMLTVMTTVLYCVLLFVVEPRLEGFVVVFVFDSRDRFVLVLLLMICATGRFKNDSRESRFPGCTYLFPAEVVPRRYKPGHTLQRVLSGTAFYHRGNTS
jgi:hypothetical protein